MFPRCRVFSGLCSQRVGCSRLCGRVVVKPGLVGWGEEGEARLEEADYPLSCSICWPFAARRAEKTFLTWRRERRGASSGRWEKTERENSSEKKREKEEGRCLCLIVSSACVSATMEIYIYTEYLYLFVYVFLPAYLCVCVRYAACPNKHKHLPVSTHVPVPAFRCVGINEPSAGVSTGHQTRGSAHARSLPFRKLRSARHPFYF